VLSTFSILDIVAALFVFMLVSAVPIQLMRNYFEGSQYQVAWSADWGGTILILVSMIGIGTLQRGPILPPWMGYPFQLAMLVISLWIGLTWLKEDWNTQWADRYHHLVVAPIQFFLILTIVPAILARGTGAEIIATLGFLALFAVLLGFDLKDGRLAQRPWLKKRWGVKFLNDDKNDFSRDDEGER
jgi:hypothetical protein